MNYPLSAPVARITWWLEQWTRQNITEELLPFIREVNFQKYGNTMFKTK